MNVEISSLLLAAAMVLAPRAQGQSTPPQPKITGVPAILSPKTGVTADQVIKILPAEIRATVRSCSRQAIYSSSGKPSIR